VTEFECATHDLGPYTWGFITFPMSESPRVVTAVDEYMRVAPNEMGIACSHGVPAQKFGLTAPESRDKLLALLVTYRGKESDQTLADLRAAVGTPLMDTVGQNDFLTLQTMADVAARAGVGWYMKSGYTKELQPGLLEWMSANAVEYQCDVSSPNVEREVYTLQALGGAISDVGEDETAYPGREAVWHAAIECGFTSPEERERIVPWIKESWKTNSSYLDMSQSYVNLNTDDGDDPIKRIFGEKKYARLQEIKTTYDPENVFSQNWNIKPRA
jgi:hypothetical protein